MAFKLKDNYGSLWPNENKNKDNQPDYTGKINIGGTEMELGGWKNETQSGKAYLSLKASEPREKKGSSDGDDGAPF
jgi:uncharacterized protein (DUF736 family)